jgi:hypothetical protein
MGLGPKGGSAFDVSDSKLTINSSPNKLVFTTVVGFVEDRDEGLLLGLDKDSSLDITNDLNKGYYRFYFYIYIKGSTGSTKTDLFVGNINDNNKTLYLSNTYLGYIQYYDLTVKIVGECEDEDINESLLGLVYEPFRVVSSRLS